MSLDLAVHVTSAMDSAMPFMVSTADPARTRLIELCRLTSKAFRCLTRRIRILSSVAPSQSMVLSPRPENGTTVRTTICSRPVILILRTMVLQAFIPSRINIL